MTFLIDLYMKLLYVAIFPLEINEKFECISESSAFTESLATRLFSTCTVDVLRVISFTILKRLSEINRSSTTITKLQYENYHFFTCTSSSGTLVVITDITYPQEVVRRLLHVMVNDETLETKKYFDLYKDPKSDKLYKIKEDLEDCKVILLDNIEKVLHRGETLDTIVEKTDQLSSNTKTFYRRAKRQNRWCPWFFTF